MKRLMLSIFASLLISALLFGCSPPHGKSPNPEPTATKQKTTPKVEETRLSASVNRVESYNYDPELFNDLFYRHPVEPLSNGRFAYFAPGYQEKAGEEKIGRVTLRLYDGSVSRTLFEGEADNWHIRSTPDGSMLSWLSWRGAGDEEHIVLLTLDLSSETATPIEVLKFPPKAVVLDYFWFTNQYIYAVAVFDEFLRDVRLLVGDIQGNSYRETIKTEGFPFLAERDTLGIAGCLAYSTSAGVGYFSACGSIFAFQLESGDGGLFLDGGDLFFLTTPSVARDGSKLSFYAIPVGGSSFVSCEMDVAKTAFCAFLDRKITYIESAVDFLFTSHSFYLSGKWSTDLVRSGDGLVSIESAEHNRRQLIKVESDVLSLIEGGKDELFVLTKNGIYLYKLSNLSFKNGFESQRWSAPAPQTGKYPDFRKPEGTLRTYLVSGYRGDSTVWSVCLRDSAAHKWLASVGEGVAGRSLKMATALRNYRRFKTILMGADKTVLEGDIEVCGDILGSDVFTLTKMGEMWIIDSIRDSASLVTE